ncbi:MULTISPECIES: Fe-S cluster assembly protein SufD [Gammaproteobacteria]|uniref:Fe-S cluster assembly protein SufD n=1 Tax=Gammaproteobacteria TaxID=1236 RepID=UPI000DD0E71E|nr:MULTISPECIES: Fe-S cluster assembly protein SufD [Gammaproteobacteria]RTE87087.1 Fe-S cluster assembly protein SufD [Aliidiomarina sp. B3213]TCZ93124.1 Fe-S cluster assembly protein SufD [Lysobacter sp. N42]
MSQWLANVLERSSADAGTLSSLREASLAKLKDISWPTRRTEAWRYTSLHPVEKLSLKTNAEVSEQFDAPEVDDLNSIDIVMVNGSLQTSIADLKLPNGVSICALNELEAGAAAKLNSAKPSHHLFGLVNDVLANSGLFIEVDAGTVVEQPIRVVNYTLDGVEAHSRVFVQLGEGAKCSVIEHGTGSEQSLNTVFSEYVIGDKAELEHYRFALHGGQAIHVGGCHFKLHNESKLNSTVVGYGSELSRLDVDIIHAAEHAHAKMNAVYLLGYKEHFDLHTNIEHTMPNGTSEENARGIVGDKARATFNGRIHIHRDAQKTLAELNNRNLLLSRGGQINTKPELEIYADDVQCAHGATVAEISDEALYYMLSRGINKSKALVMLNFGFIQELVNQMPNKALANWLQPQLRARFEEMGRQ